jgi:hypothetical protein
MVHNQHGKRYLMICLTQWRTGMNLLKNMSISALVFVVFCHFLPAPLMAQEILLAANTRITKHPIDTTSTPDEALATEKDKKSNMLIWSLVGIALIGGIAAAAGGGGGGGGGDDDTPTTGTIPVEW